MEGGHRSTHYGPCGGLSDAACWQQQGLAENLEFCVFRFSVSGSRRLKKDRYLATFDCLPAGSPPPTSLGFGQLGCPALGKPPSPQNVVAVETVTRDTAWGFWGES